MSDPRFARLHTDPRFVRPKASKNKIVVDDRFKQLFEDQDASAGSKGKRKVDKYGRPLEKEASVNELKRYYRMASPETEAMKKGEAGEEESDDEENEDEGDEEDESGDERGDAAPAKSFVDLARGEVMLESSDEEDDDDDDDQDEAAVTDAESDSSSAAGTVSLGPSSRRRRAPSRSPSIDLSETERPLFPDEDDEDGELDSDDEGKTANPTKRIAVVNMDWDNLRASDLYRVLASSLSATATSVETAPQPKASGSSTKFDADGNEVGPYKPSAKLSIAPGRLLHLRIYPSSFGRERMEREAIEGPPVEVLRTKGAESDDDEEDGVLRLGRKAKGKAKERRRRRGEEDEEDVTEQDLLDEQLQENSDDYDTEALRKYQLERYYYAVATFDRVSAAQHVVREIDGTEFERTANIFDLQFIPDETSFDEDPVHDEATEATIAAEGNSYQGIDFSTDALRHSKVKLTWDADDPHRKTKMQNYLAAALDKSKQKGATKGRPKIGDADIAQYLASSSEDEGEGEEEDEGEADDFFEAEEEKDSKSKKEKKREKMRKLLGLDGGEEEEHSWDGGAKSSKGGQGGMQITFAPALSERSAKQLDLVEGDKPETAIEIYRRKEKERKERKKAERKAKAEGRDFDEEGPFGEQEGEDKGFDDDFFADDGVKDPFANLDDRAGDSGDEIGTKTIDKRTKKKLSKKEKKAQREAEEKIREAEQGELALLVGSDDEDDVLGGDGEGGRHFDMRKILKSEKTKGKKVKAKGKKAKEAEAPVKDDFKIDLADDRFKSLHDDFDFAIDPSNPKYQKTRNMDALLAEGRKRRAKRSEARAPVDASEVARKKAGASAGGDGESLNKLIESVKRKAGETGGRGKRTKTE
ncbi:hypothetical protein JCM10212_005213 [Sporobolomyces blumeae]